MLSAKPIDLNVDTSALIIGKSGTGKTSTLVSTFYRDLPNSFIIFDELGHIQNELDRDQRTWHFSSCNYTSELDLAAEIAKSENVIFVKNAIDMNKILKEVQSIKKEMDNESKLTILIDEYLRNKDDLDTNIIQNLMLNGREEQISIVVTSQSEEGIPKEIKNSVSSMYELNEQIARISFIVNRNEEAREIAENIMKDSTEEGFWYSSAVDILSAVILKVAHDKNGKVRLDEIEDEINQADTEPDYFINNYENMSEEHIAYEYFKVIKTAKGKSKASMLSTIKQQLH